MVLIEVEVDVVRSFQFLSIKLCFSGMPFPSFVILRKKNMCSVKKLGSFIGQTSNNKLFFKKKLQFKLWRKHF